MTSRISAKLEDYLAAILKFQREERFARVSDIAANLGVAKSAVTVALQKLSAAGLVNYQSYKPVTLTEQGEKFAEEILLRHRVILDFLQTVLGIESDRADEIACEMEHAIDKPALERFICFLAFVSSRPDPEHTWLREFRQFLETGANSFSCKECVKVYLDNVTTQDAG